MMLDEFWSKRSANYDKLFWTKDIGYLDTIIKISDLCEDHFVLDVGTGTGAISQKVKPMVKHIIGLDISEDMLKQSNWDGVSRVKWDIRDALFTNNVFDRIIARMVFHHIVNNLDLAIERCYNMLKQGGKLVVAEGVPPSDDPGIVEWYSDMFRLKEDRLTFSPAYLVGLFNEAGFKDVKCYEYLMKNFSVNNWLKNSGLDDSIQYKILNLHINADQKIRDLYNMCILNEHVYIDAKNVIVVGTK